MDSVKTDGRSVPAINDEMIEAGEKALSDVIWQFRYVMPIDGMRRVLEAALAASPPAGAEVVRVKPLVWHDHPAGGKQALAAGLGLYRVHINGKSWYLNQDYMGEGGEAAAQADYGRRILSALEPTPSTDAVRRQAREEALEEAARAFDKTADACAAYTRTLKTGSDAWKLWVVSESENRRAARAVRSLSTPPAGAAALNEGE